MTCVIVVSRRLVGVTLSCVHIHVYTGDVQRQGAVHLHLPIDVSQIFSNYYSYYYHYFIYLSSTILYYANHVTLSLRRHSSIELWRMRLISVSK